MASRLERLQDWELQSEDGELPPTFPIDYEAEILHTPMLEDVRSASQDWHLDAAQIENILASENAIGFEGFWLGRYETEQSSDASGDISRSPDRNRSIDVHEMFPLLDSTQRTDPPSCKDKMQEQKPKSDLVLYTPLWVRGEGAERAGWCGFCPSWHRLKDSTFNYHMQFTHGVLANGQQMKRPQLVQSHSGSWSARCQACGTEIDIELREVAKARNAFFHHAHKCRERSSGRVRA